MDGHGKSVPVMPGGLSSHGGSATDGARSLPHEDAMKAAVIVFPGSNCDRDMMVAIEKTSGVRPLAVWHRETTLPDVDLIALPGGFSYGDYLRCGAIAARSPIVPAILRAAERGVLVLGVCNGFQILTEIGLLPGALMRNRGLDFRCHDTLLEVVSTESPFTAAYRPGERIRIPIAHHDGQYFADDETLAMLEGEGRIALRYLDNPNGSRADIAGLFDRGRRVLGMMPHPERMIEAEHGGTDGRRLFEGALAVLATA